MKKIIVITICFVFAISKAFGQQPTQDYYQLVQKAFSLYEAKDYKSSALTYSAAFKSWGWKGQANDRYNAACSWALGGNADSAFFCLMRLAEKLNYNDYEHLTTDTDLDALHKDKRWQPLVDIVKANKEKAEANLNKPLAQHLDSIHTADQDGRLKTDEVQKKYGYDSKEMKELWVAINKSDSINLVKVKLVLDKYGWLGADVVGQTGNSTLFLVIQHADLKTQEHYLPMMKEAVKNKKASPPDLALLVDRIEMRNNRPQIYGSQINMKDGKYIIYTIIDEPNVNKRRAEVGLQPLENYVQMWGIDYKVPEK
jgi:hypothetical protein